MPKKISSHLPEVTLYMATSLEGFIADEHGTTSWVCSQDSLLRSLRLHDCVCMGYNAYNHYNLSVFKDVPIIVLVRTVDNRQVRSNEHFVSSPQDALACARNLGARRMLVIGGAKANESFMQERVVNKVICDIHPLLLKKGLPMFGRYKQNFAFKMKQHKWQPEGFMHVEYTVRFGPLGRKAVSFKQKDNA